MPKEKKIFAFNGVQFKLYAPDDLSRNWYLEWYDGTKRFKKYGNINGADTFMGRYQRAEALAKQLSLKLTDLKSVSVGKVHDYIVRMDGRYAPSTYMNIKGITNQFVKFLGNREVTRLNVEAFFSELEKTHHATTYNEYRMWIGRTLSDLEMHGMLVNVKRKKTTKTPQRYFQKHHIKKLRDYMTANEPELWLFVQFIFYCFIRPGRELPHLRAGDFFMEERQILMRAEITKNRKNQYIGIPEPLFAQLDFIYDMKETDYIFPGRHRADKPVGRNTMATLHAKILKELGFGKGYSLYSWKHTGAVEAVRNGASVNDLKIQLRHYSLAETDMYLRQLGVKDISKLMENFPDLNSL